MLALRGVDQLKVDQFFAGHHARRDFGYRQASSLGDEGHRAAGARIDLEDVDATVLDRKLDIHQADHAKSFGKRNRLAFELGNDVVG